MEGKHLYLAAREAFFQPYTAISIPKTLTAAAAASYEMPGDTAWLCSMANFSGRERLRNLLNCIVESHSTTPLANYYRERSLMELGVLDPHVVVSNMDDDDAHKLYCRAQMASYAFKREALMNRAVLEGHPQAMGVLVDEYAETLSAIEYAVYSARYVLLAGDSAFLPNCLLFKTAQQFFYAGRELEGYRRLWNDKVHPSSTWLHCIFVYQRVTDKARRAALQTIVALRPLCGGSRDVARLIGKAVYKTRYTDTEAWWNEKVP
jgi:hypothetical protein